MVGFFPGKSIYHFLIVCLWTHGLNTQLLDVQVVTEMQSKLSGDFMGIYITLVVMSSNTRKMWRNYVICLQLLWRKHGKSNYQMISIAG